MAKTDAIVWIMVRGPWGVVHIGIWLRGGGSCDGAIPGGVQESVSLKQASLVWSGKLGRVEVVKPRGAAAAFAIPSTSWL